MLGTKGKGLENMMTGKKGGLGDKSAFVTPLGMYYAYSYAVVGWELMCSCRSSQSRAFGHEDDKRKSESLPNTSRSHL